MFNRTGWLSASQTSTSSALRHGSPAWSARVRAPSTVLRAHGVLSGILADAVKAKRLAVNPAKGVENLPHKSAKRRIYLSADDVHRLAGESGQHRALVLVLAYCGLRWGEAVALRVADVEFLRRRLSVQRMPSSSASTSRSGRQRAARPVRCRCPSSCSTSCRCCARGKVLTHWCSARGSRRVSAAPEVVGWLVRRGGAARQVAGGHPARFAAHSASLSISAGVNVLALQRMLGHTSAKVTLDAYCRPVRRRPRRGCSHASQPLLALKCGQSVGTGRQRA